MGRQRGHSYCQRFESSGMVRRVLWQSCRLFRCAHCLNLHGSTTLFSQQPPDEGRKLLRQASHLPTYAASCSGKLYFQQYRCESHKFLRTHCRVTCVCTLTQMQVSTSLAPRDEVWTVEEMCLISSPFFKFQISKRWLGRKSWEWCGYNLMFST
jgi:hypothetical protein